MTPSHQDDDAWCVAWAATRILRERRCGALLPCTFRQVLD